MDDEVLAILEQLIAIDREQTATLELHNQLNSSVLEILQNLLVRIVALERAA